MSPRNSEHQPVPWSPEVLLVWGKTDPDPGSDAWLPLVRHLEDSAAIGEVLFDRWLAPAQRERIASVLGSVESARSLAAFLCGIHDIGKCAPAFAVKALQVPGYTFLHTQLHTAGFDFAPEAKERPTPHGIIGQAVVVELLSQLANGGPTRDVHDYAEIVGGHHGKNPTFDDVHRLPTGHRGAGRWDQARREIWNGMAQRTGADRHLADWVSIHLPVTVQMTLSALVIVADWMASGTDLFPYDDLPTRERLDRALQLINLPDPWLPKTGSEDAATLLTNRFPKLSGRVPHPVQSAVVRACRDMAEPSMLIVEAPMGCGKTEAAMMGAEILASRFGLGGTFFGLPTMATANPMFSRVRSWLELVRTEAATTLNLVHSKAALNDDFADLMRSPVAGIVDDEGQRGARAEVTAASWFWGRKRSALATHVVGTIDQALFAGLKAKHVVLRHLALDGKVVVIDEVHAADDYMRVYLMCVLAWLGAYRTPVILMSATLPPDQRRELAGAYASGRTGKTVTCAADESQAYPRLTVVGTGMTDCPVEQPVEERVVRLVRQGHSVEEVVAALGDLLADGGCAGVICNTVSRAQEVYDGLRQVFGTDTRLMHSKFVAPHRTRMESQLVVDLGPASASRPHRLVVVGTQVLEQSLDVDFDVMISDIAPMDLLLQRIGRLHRHRRGEGECERPAALRVPTCLITGLVDRASVPPTLDKGSVAVYGASKLLRTLAVLGDATEIRLPQDLPGLVSAAYSADLSAPEGWQEAWMKAETRAAAKIQKQQHDAKAFELISPIKDAGLAGLINHEAQDPDAPRAIAQVRDIEESLEVVVISRDSDGALRMLDDVGDYSRRIIPSALTGRDRDLGRAVATCTVTMPGTFTRAPQEFDATLTALEDTVDASGWQTSPWLSGQLFLVLDPDGRCTIGERTLAYDARLGLRVVDDQQPVEDQQSGETT
ncbi:MAG: CRISPR-associated helicase Cas3' [Propionibacteriales bacterium]|nr:CRISPR-associated helicase Cas3' [Propionibacteriales bacterium]